jgi:hypothetical protein
MRVAFLVFSAGLWSTLLAQKTILPPVPLPNSFGAAVSKVWASREKGFGALRGESRRGEDTPSPTPNYTSHIFRWKSILLIPGFVDCEITVREAQLVPGMAASLGSDVYDVPSFDCRNDRSRLSGVDVAEDILAAMGPGWKKEKMVNDPKTQTAYRVFMVDNFAFGPQIVAVCGTGDFADRIVKLTVTIGLDKIPSALPLDVRQTRATGMTPQVESAPLPDPVRTVNKTLVSGLATIVIRNSTSYTLVLTLTGPTSAAQTVLPGDTASLTLTSGDYSLIGTVNSPSVLPFAGKTTLPSQTQTTYTFTIH